MPKKTTQFFISANTERGFYSLYDNIFRNRDFDRIFVIHGGPGTGKSTLMRKVADEVRKRGADCEEILCSSDPTSLDGLVICQGGKKIGVLDGTPPHARIISEAGVKETLWNVCEFIRTEKLEKRQEEIKKFAKKKKDSYQKAYVLLHAAGTVERYLTNEEAGYLKKEKLSQHLQRTAKGFRVTGEITERFIHAISGKGEYIISLSNVFFDNIVLLCGKKESASIYLSHLSDSLREKNIAHTRFSSPLVPEFLDGIFINESSTLYLAESLAPKDCAGKKIHMARFFEKAPKEDRKKLKRIYAEALEGACEALKKAGQAHSALEEIYVSAMDFKGMEKTKQKWIADLLSLLEK